MPLLDRRPLVRRQRQHDPDPLTYTCEAYGNLCVRAAAPSRGHPARAPGAPAHRPILTSTGPSKVRSISWTADDAPGVGGDGRRRVRVAAQRLQARLRECARRARTRVRKCRRARSIYAGSDMKLKRRAAAALAPARRCPRPRSSPASPILPLRPAPCRDLRSNINRDYESGRHLPRWRSPPPAACSSPLPSTARSGATSSRS